MPLLRSDRKQEHAGRTHSEACSPVKSPSVKPHGFRSALSPFAGFFLFLLLIRTRNFVDPVLNNMGAQRLGSYTPAVVISLLPILFSFGVLVYQNGSVSGALEELGLRANIPLAALFGFCATLPALVGFALTAQIYHDLSATASAWGSREPS